MIGGVPQSIVQFAKFGIAEAARLGEFDGFKPELGIALGLLNVNMTRLCALTTEKEKAVSTDAKHFRHARSVLEKNTWARL